MTRDEQLAAGQGVFFLVCGLWPVFDRSSFEKATGPKTDFWLVRTVALLLASTGASLAAAAVRRSVRTETALLGAASAASLAGIDLVYGLRGRISRIYLVDAAVQGALTAMWFAVCRRTVEP